jgi:hypothetical protein
MLVPTSRFYRAVVPVVLAVPLIVIVLLSIPAWIVWPFLSANRQAGVMQFLDRIIEWVKVLSRIG